MIIISTIVDDIPPAPVRDKRPEICCIHGALVPLFSMHLGDLYRVLLTDSSPPHRVVTTLTALHFVSWSSSRRPNHPVPSAPRLPQSDSRIVISNVSHFVVVTKYTSHSRGLALYTRLSPPPPYASSHHGSASVISP